MIELQHAVCDVCGEDLGNWLPVHANNVVAEHRQGNFFVKCTEPAPKPKPKAKKARKPTPQEQERSKAQAKIDNIIKDLVRNGD